ncbi:MAG: glycerate kinase, partial [Muribaculaceae bacterium]
MKIVIAPDKYKGFFSAEEASDIMYDIVHRRLPDAEIKICPMADGGEGTAKILSKSMGAIPFTSTTKNAYNEDISFTYYATDSCAILESAEIIGLQKVKSPLSPLDVSTYSLGKIFAHLTKEYQQTILCIGGTSTVDCGIGFLQAMGMVCKYQGHIIDEIFTPRNYLHFDEFIFPDIPNCTTNSHIALCDVQNDILRPDGQDMTLFAPQKGLKLSEMPFLRQMIKHITTIAKWNRTNSFAQIIGAAGGGLAFAFAQLFSNVKLGAQFLIEKYGI